MSILQGGSGFPCLAKPVYDYFFNNNIDLYVPDETLRYVLDKVY